MSSVPTSLPASRASRADGAAPWRCMPSLAAMAPAGALDLERDGRDWPHREASRLVDAGGSRWHVQVMGAGPVAVLLHGAGASCHSFRDLMPVLSRRFTTVALDLPGQGFSTPAPVERMSLQGMAVGVAALLRELALEPSLMVGHSAGAAVAARICLDRLAAPRALVSLNGALLPLVGMVGALFAPTARLFADVGLVPRLVARAARAPGAVERLVRDTGSALDAEGIRLYRRLASSPGHVTATLRMMARWDLHGLERDLPRLRVPLTLVVGEQDRTVAPRYSQRVHEMIPGSRLVQLPGLGHLAHEEQPGRVCEIIMSAAGPGPCGSAQARASSLENGHAS